MAEIQGYHNTAFNQHHIPLDAWTPNYALNLLESDTEKEKLWDALLASSSLGAWAEVVASVLTSAGPLDGDAYAYLARLTSAGAFATAFDSNEFGLYDVVTDEGTHVIGHDAGSGLIGGTGGTDVVMGFDGDDVLSGGDGADYLHGGRGNDFLLGDAGVDELSGDEGNDIIDGGEGDDVVFLSDDGDADIVIVGEGQDRIVGGDAFDRLVIRASNFWIPTAERLIEQGWSELAPSAGATGFEPELAVRTGIPLLGGFSDPRWGGGYTDYFTGERVRQWKYVPAAQTLVAPILEGEGVEGFVLDRKASYVGPSAWRELSAFFPDDNEPDIEQSTGSVTSITNQIVNSDISYNLYPDSRLKIGWHNSEGWHAGVTIEDFEEGDFGIRLFDGSQFEARYLRWNWEPGDWTMTASYVDDPAGVSYIHNGGEYVDLPETPGQLQAPAYGGRPLHASLSNETPGITEEIGVGHDLAFAGSDFDDTVVFTGGIGAFALGGLGQDTVVFSGLVSDYLLSGEGDCFTVANAAGGDSFRFSQFEAMRFGGGAALSLASAMAAFHHKPGDTWLQPEALGTLFAPPGIAA